MRKGLCIAACYGYRNIKPTLQKQLYFFDIKRIYVMHLRAMTSVILVSVFKQCRW